MTEVEPNWSGSIYGDGWIDIAMETPGEYVSLSVLAVTARELAEMLILAAEASEELLNG